MFFSNVLGKLAALFRLPAFIDENQNQRAVILYSILWSLVALAVIYLILSLILVPGTYQQDLAISIVGILANLLLLFLLSRKQLDLASILQIACLWLMFTAIMILNNGVLSPAYAMGYFLVILIAGLLLGKIGATIMTILSLLVGLIVCICQVFGILHTGYTSSILSVWVVSAFMFPAAAFLQYLAARTLRIAFTRASESEARFRSLSDAAFEGLMINQNGIILDANQKFVEMFGYENPADIIGKNGYDLLLTPESSLAFRNTPKDPTKPVYEVTGLRKDGSTFPGETQSQVTRYKGQLVSVAAMRDITERKQFLNMLEEANRQLETAYDATLQGWSSALELRERETAGHSLRVVELTLELAKMIGVSEQQMIHLRRGALLHDIGKMGLPDNILLKPGPLTDEEWSAMRFHTVHAFTLLKNIPFLQRALDIPYYHHEWWNGTGYPRQLKGEQIPLAARIFAVVDVWDALTSDRPYRSAWSHQETIEYIQNQAGIQFDPLVVEKFVTIIKKYSGS